MLRTRALVIGFFMVIVSVPGMQQAVLRITNPANGAKINEEATIEGTVGNLNVKDVWVIVHPAAKGDYWVQQVASVREDKTWKVQIRVGEPDTKTGTRFEIRAVANPKTKLNEGTVLHAWPTAQWMSQIIEVTR